MKAVLMILFVFVAAAMAQNDSTVNGPDTGYSRAVMEKHVTKWHNVNKNDTVIIQATIRRKNNGGSGEYINIGKIKYIKPTKSDTGMTTQLWNMGATFIDVPCDTCTKR